MIYDKKQYMICTANQFELFHQHNFCSQLLLVSLINEQIPFLRLYTGTSTVVQINALGYLSEHENVLIEIF